MLEQGLLPLVLLPSSVQHGAICNDGSAPGYYHKIGAPGSRWLIYLQGGFWCWDAASCDARYRTAPHYFSSSTLPRLVNLSANDCTTPQGGLHDADLDSLCGGVFSSSPDRNPPYHDAHRVYIPYCSSDAWTGDTANASDRVTRWHFRGRRIVQAVLRHLYETHGKELVCAPSIGLAGQSAGGLGALTNVDAAAKTLHDWAETAGGCDGARLRPRVYGMSDGGFFRDAAPFGKCAMKDDCPEEAGRPPIRLGTQFAQGYRLWNAKVGAACEAAVGTDHAHTCLQGPVAAAHTTTPLFIAEHQSDCWQSAWNGVLPTGRHVADSWCSKNGVWPKDGAAYTYAVTARYQMRASLAALAPNATHPARRTIFSAACFKHINMIDDSYDQTLVRVGALLISARDHLDDWVAALEVDAPPPPPVLDACIGLQCAARCAAPAPGVATTAAADEGDSVDRRP